jgi:hypothetical protein
MKPMTRMTRYSQVTKEGERGWYRDNTIFVLDNWCYKIMKKRIPEGYALKTVCVGKSAEVLQPPPDAL